MIPDDCEIRRNNYVTDSLFTTKQNFFSSGKNLSIYDDKNDEIPIKDEMKDSIGLEKSEINGINLSDYQFPIQSATNKQHYSFNETAQTYYNDDKRDDRRDIESRERLSRMQSRLEAKRDREQEEEEKFQNRIRQRLNEWNVSRNRAEEDQLKRYEDYRYNRFENRVQNDDNNIYDNKKTNDCKVEILRDPSDVNINKDDDETKSQKMKKASALSEKIRQLRINNAKVLGLSDEQLKTEKEEGFMSSSIIDMNQQTDILLS